MPTARPDAQDDAAPPLGLSADELLTTTRAVRRRLDLARPVPRAVVEECLRIGLQAPSGGNRQDYGWVLVDDPDLRRAMGELYREAFAANAAAVSASSGSAPAAPAHPPAMAASVEWLRQHMGEVPVLVVPTFPERFDLGTAFGAATAWGSVLPAVWNFMLALRSRGLGSTWTTVHLHKEAEMAELLGIPHPDQRQAGLFPVAYTLGTAFKPGERGLGLGVHWNRWGGTRA